MNVFKSLMLSACFKQHGGKVRSLVRQLHAVNHEPVYELRVYTIKPEQTTSFVRLTNDFLELRMAHSKLIGYWMAELGSLNQAYHLWEFDNYDHRTKVRKNLTTDAFWQEKYMKHMFKMIESQTNATMKLIENTSIQAPSKPGYYEYQYYQLNKCLTASNADIRKMLEIIRTIYQFKDSSLVGSFITDFGLENAVHLFLHHQSIESAALSKKHLKENKIFISLPFWNEVIRSNSVILSPITVSPMQ